MSPGRIFLLSPAKSSGLRAELLAGSNHEIGRALRSEAGAPLGRVFEFLSSLYFRGKLTYAIEFGATNLGVPGALIITPGHGLCRPETRIRASDLAGFGGVQIDESNPSFVEPLVRDARLLAERVSRDCEIVLLGSIATPKYVAPLLQVFEERLLFPSEFVGRGDMSRGGLLLRAARAGRELEYVPVVSTERSGKGRAKRLAELG